MPRNYLNKKRILITGIKGFIGSRLAVKFSRQGADIYGVSRTSDEKNILKASVVDYSVLDEYVKKKKIEICFHLAAESLVESGQKDPYQTFKINTLGTLNVLEIARKNNLEKIIIASTSHVYGDNKLPYRESDPPRPSRPYETSKTCTDLIAQSYADTFNLPVLIPRFINVYGPGDLNLNRLIPKTIKSILSNESPTMWGGDAVREYLYIDDVVNAYMILAGVDMSKVGKQRIFNFGTGNRVSVQDLIQILIDLSGKNLKIQKIASERTAEIKAQYVSWEKARKILKWEPKFSLEDGLKKTLRWYRDYFERN